MTYPAPQKDWVEISGCQSGHPLSMDDPAKGLSARLSREEMSAADKFVSCVTYVLEIDTVVYPAKAFSHEKKGG